VNLRVGESVNFQTLVELGFGQPNSRNFIGGLGVPEAGYNALIVSSLVANSPQILLSTIYLFFNALCTRLFLALEWSTYSQRRKPLRVSYPSGHQRSTYFLQIPFRYGIPLLAYSVLLHWLISQSIFLVSINYPDNPQFDSLFGPFGPPETAVISCGYSPLGMILTTIAGASLILLVLFIGYFKRLECGMPLVGNCSAAIAAACHAPEGDSALEPVKWGVVPTKELKDFDMDFDGFRDGVQHISFSSGMVSSPVPGHLYA
jgi:hypothetical protein